MKKLQLNPQRLDEGLTRSQIKLIFQEGDRSCNCPSISSILFGCGFSNHALLCECITVYGVDLSPGGQSLA